MQRWRDFAPQADAFDRDGFVVLRGALGAADVAMLTRVFDERLQDAAHTAPLFAGDATILQSHGCNPDDPAIAHMLQQSPVADIAQGLFGGRPVWYWSEQAWLKEGGAARRTPWHQDFSFMPFAGAGFVVLWIPLDDLPRENVLEVVRGSHRRTLYNGVQFDPQDDTAPLYDDPAFPQLPDIEADRAHWDICASDLARGDVLAFHPGCLHGGAPVHPGQRRRAISFRLFSDDIVYRPLPPVRHTGLARTQEERREKLVTGFEGLKPGDPIHQGGGYRQVRSSASQRQN